MGEDESEEEESTDSEEEEKPALESDVVEQDVTSTATVVNELERVSRVVNDASSSTNPQIEKGAGGGGKDARKKETDLSKKDLDNAEDSESEEASEEDGDEENLWGAILGPK